MSLRDFQEMVKAVKEKLEQVAKCNPALDLARGFAYLANVDGVLRNYENDYRAGQHQTLLGFKEMAQFNFGRAEQILFEAYQQTIDGLKHAFTKKAHGRVEVHLIKAVVLRADEVLRMEGFASAKRLLERADYAFYLVDYDLMVNELRRLAGLPVLEVNTKKTQVSTVKFYRKPLAVKVESVAHKVTAPTPPSQKETKVFSGRFVDPSASVVVPMIDPSTPVLGMSTDLQRNRISQRRMASLSSTRGVVAERVGSKAAVSRAKRGKKG